MSYIRHKTIKGHNYYYEVESVRKGNKVVQKHVRYIGKSLKNISGISNHIEDNKLNVLNLKEVPNDRPGIYYLYDKDKNLIYIGRAGATPGFGLRHRLSAHYQKDNHRPQWEHNLSRDAVYFLVKPYKSDTTARKTEIKEIKKYEPKYNTYNKE